MQTEISKPKKVAQLYNFRDHMKDAGGYNTILRTLAHMGWQGVELAGAPKDVTATMLRSWLDTTGLEVVGSHESMARLKEQLPEVIEFNKIIGNEYIILPIVRSNELDTQEKVDNVIKFMHETSAKLYKEGLLFLYHNHDHELSLKVPKNEISGHSEIPVLRYMLQGTSTTVSFELDTYWVSYAGEDPAKLMSDFRGRFPIIHIKDGILNVTNPIFRELGDGDMDFAPIFKAIRDDPGIRCVVYEQDRDFKENPIKSAEKSLDWLVKNF